MEPPDSTTVRYAVFFWLLFSLLSVSVGDTDVWFVSDVTPVLRIALNICVKVHSFFLLVVAVVTHNDFWWCYGLASCPLEVQPGGGKKLQF